MARMIGIVLLAVAMLGAASSSSLGDVYLLGRALKQVRSLMLTFAYSQWHKSDATYRLQAPSPNIMLEAVHLAENTGEDVVHTLESVFEFLIGSAENFTTNFPEDISKLDWESLSHFNLQQPVDAFLSHLGSAANSVGSAINSAVSNVVGNITAQLPALPPRPDNVWEAEQDIDDLISEFCSDVDVEESEMLPAACIGKSLIISLRPWKCELLLNATSKAIACTPAVLQLQKNPASCATQGKTAFSYTGKECKYQKAIGQKQTKIIGGDAFSVDIPQNILEVPSDIADDLLGFNGAPVTATASSIVVVPGGETATVTGTATATGGR